MRRSIAYGYLRRAERATEDRMCDGHDWLVVAGESVPARVHLWPLCDRAGARIRA